MSERDKYGENDISVVHPSLRQIYLKPEKQLGLDKEKVTVDTLRDIFRKNCIGLMAEFANSGKPKFNEQQLVLAYHLARGTIKGTANEIKHMLETSPYFRFKANYMLPILRPVKTLNFTYNKSFRGFQMLAVIFETSVLEYKTFLLWEAKFTFTVEYVLRRHKVSKTYYQFVEFHNELSKELLVIPVLPASTLNTTQLGLDLQEYILKIHHSLADRGLFSPRLMKFLEIDHEQVQTEEEGAFVLALDSFITIPANTCWHIIDEKWLQNWRTYIRGRPPRRYFPPGPINNHTVNDLWKEYIEAEEAAKKEQEEEEERRRQEAEAAKKEQEEKENGKKVGGGFIGNFPQIGLPLTVPNVASDFSKMGRRFTIFTMSLSGKQRRLSLESDAKAGAEAGGGGGGAGEEEDNNPDDKAVNNDDSDAKEGMRQPDEEYQKKVMFSDEQQPPPNDTHADSKSKKPKKRVPTPTPTTEKIEHIHYTENAENYDEDKDGDDDDEEEEKKNTAKVSSDSIQKTKKTKEVDEDDDVKVIRKLQDIPKLKVKEHYRCINFNVWQFLHLVHGGGPVMGRELPDIYSKVSYSFLQAVVMVQSVGRIYIARRRLKLMLYRTLSSTLTGRTFLYQEAKRLVSERANQLIISKKKELVSKKLEDAAVFTQTLWRNKKNYFVEEALLSKQREQDVFRIVDNINRDVPKAFSNGMVVQDFKPVVSLGNTNIYARTIPMNNGRLPFIIQRKTGTELAMIKSANDESKFYVQSIIVSINGIPTNTMIYDQIREALSAATFPMVLELEKPYNLRLLPTLFSIGSNCLMPRNEKDQLDQLDPIAIYSAFKLALVRGFRLMKWNTRNAESHPTMLKITDREIMYKRVTKDPTVEWVRFSLFDIKFVREGKDSENVRSKSREFYRCFEIVLEDRKITFELLSLEEYEKDLKQMVNELDDTMFMQQEVASVTGSIHSRTSHHSHHSHHSRASQLQQKKKKRMSMTSLNTMTRQLKKEQDELLALAKQEKTDLDEFKQKLNEARDRHTKKEGSAADTTTPEDKVIKEFNELIENTETKDDVLFVFVNQVNKSLKLLKGKEDMGVHILRDLIVGNLRKLVNEIRGTQIFVNKSGLPIRRRRPKSALKQVEVQES
jgi:hypothetical protein